MNGHGIRVILIDDHTVLRDGLKLLLSLEPDLEVVGEAADGESAIEQTTSLSPDLILLDVQLPDIDGFEVASRVTRIDGAPAVVLISSRERGDFGPLVQTSGARGFVAKADLSGERLRALLDT